MRTVTLGVSSIEDTKRQMAAAFRGEQPGAFISFASIELLWQVLTAKRWEILRAMTGQGALSIGEMARRVGRDGKAGHGNGHSSTPACSIARRLGDCPVGCGACRFHSESGGLTPSVAKSRRSGRQRRRQVAERVGEGRAALVRL